MTRYWLGLCAGLCTVIAAAQPPQPPPGPPPAAAQAQSAEPGDAESDDEFFEFLGADDVGDAAWWDFLRKSAPRKDPPPAPPQDAKP